MNARLFRALRLLADGRFHSGADIARGLARSRAAVSDALKHAGELGVEVFSVPGKGYRLAAPVEFLDAHAIVAALGPAAAKLRLTLLDEADSTSSRAAALAQAGAPSGTCVAAEWQHAGRGRRGRAWQSGLGGSLLFSLLWRFDHGPAQLTGLPLAVAVAVARALEGLGVAGVGLKWPNDLVHDGRKLGGILVETTGEMQGPTAVVIGVGLNVRLSAATETRIDQPATDIATVAGRAVSRNALLAAALAELSAAMERFSAEGFGAFRADWQARHAYAGREVIVRAGEEPAAPARVVDVAEDGALVVEQGGATRRLTSAEISLRPA